jgi:hypothetical protein
MGSSMVTILQRPGDEHQAVGFARQIVEFFRQAEFLAGGHLLAAKPEAHLRVVVAAVEGDAHAPRHTV